MLLEWLLEARNRGVEGRTMASNEKRKNKADSVVTGNCCSSSSRAERGGIRVRRYPSRQCSLETLTKDSRSSRSCFLKSRCRRDCQNALEFLIAFKKSPK
ncbi:Tenascin-X [Manis pentadactyla]|nr:Tenascin-X [Manis pentadactyla]